MVLIQMKFNQHLTLLPKFDERFQSYIEKPIHDLTYKEDLSKEEVYLASFNEDDKVIDLDELEIVLAKKYKRCRNCSMDLSFVISDEDEKAKEVVLVEYRFNYSIPSKLVKSDLDNKVKFSKIYTQFIYQIPVHKKKYFVFKTNKVPEFERRLRRMDPSCSPDYIACSIKDISEKFFR